jgi:hypothetical protein
MPCTSWQLLKRNAESLAFILSRGTKKKVRERAVAAAAQQLNYGRDVFNLTMESGRLSFDVNGEIRLAIQ